MKNNIEDEPATSDPNPEELRSKRLELARNLKRNWKTWRKQEKEDGKEGGEEETISEDEDEKEEKPWTNEGGEEETRTAQTKVLLSPKIKLINRKEENQNTEVEIGKELGEYKESSSDGRLSIICVKFPCSCFLRRAEERIRELKDREESRPAANEREGKRKREKPA